MDPWSSDYEFPESDTDTDEEEVPHKYRRRVIEQGEWWREWNRYSFQYELHRLCNIV